MVLLSASLPWPKAARPAAWLLASTALALVAVVGAAAAAWRWHRGRRRRRRLLHLKQVGTVSGLFIYPIKSCRGAAVRQAQVTQLGLRSGDLRDR